MKKYVKIAGVVTLYNPSDEDINNINTYINDIEELYVIDNTEGKSNESRIPKNKKIKYYFKNDNMGVASAINIAAEKAIKDGYDWLLTMDQDTKVNDGVIKKLKTDILTKDMDKVGIITPWHNTKLLDKKPNSKIDYPHDVMTSGNILNLKIWKEINGFKDWLFIDGIDIEYCLNLRKNGYKIMRDNTVFIDHNLGNIFYKQFLGKPRLCTNHTAIRRYYMARNYRYIFDMYKDYDYEFCLKLTKYKKDIIKILLYEKNSFKKILGIYKGIIDYKKGIKGKFGGNL